MRKLVSLILCLCLLAGSAPPVSAEERLSNRQSRRYVEAMLGYHLQENQAVRQTLADGKAAVFFFEGCSDNMDDPQLCDLSYYRVSAVCIVLRLDEKGEPYVAYFNEDASTLPDRPLEYGKWHLDGVGDVGPATVCDGTYELYSVYHAGAYEALHLRTKQADGRIAAVYMTPEGPVSSRATEINIHTRTGNHTIEGAMWSAGCMLVGDGDFEDFAQLIEATYYPSYQVFYKGVKVGCVTIDRQNLRQEMLELYESSQAVDWLLAQTAGIQPETYFNVCGDSVSLEEELLLQAAEETELMTLPCSRETDPRSVSVLQLQPGDRVGAVASIVNSLGETWYQVELLDGPCWLYAGKAEEVPQNWWDWILDVFGWK